MSMATVKTSTKESNRFSLSVVIPSSTKHTTSPARCELSRSTFASEFAPLLSPPYATRHAASFAPLQNKSSLSEVSRKRVLNTTQPSNNDNHTEHLSTDPTCLKLQNELQVYVRQEAIKDHLHLMKLDDGKDDPEVNINTTALREVKIEAAHGAMAKIEQRSNGAVTLVGRDCASSNG
ncbi:hypothetical protein MVLG_03808 [Microbotryum lychnidis-dioicae p1A1 Lamole]|uniref:Uncharacterized protein n=1 Tax=Microbotryum lychnidis-dioicae (strain p1A1 Lamole / MvSl-1064) TaxID=683840 RepID=U5H9B6_USTV1|nr:hypothetical protein MVLG_03808 [Microbotryum lychnidis-dioicae p1A1 Lamole]|eukprot:KDE05865.1 hypothetical protein MVLG_03808 [Microbotryum lychnidis-dioicae p1A1 Lamole]